MGTRSAVARPFPDTPPGQLVPNPELLRLVREEPVSRVRLPYGGDAWLVTRHADVKTVLTDRRFSRAAAVRDDLPRSTPRVPRPDSLLAMDPPEHSRLRDPVNRVFTTRRVDALRPRTEEMVGDLLDEVERRGAGGRSVDLIPAFCAALPVMLLCELLGVPVGDRTRFREWSHAFVSSTPLGLPEIMAADRQLREYLAGLVARRRQEPRDDLISALVTDSGPRPMSADEIVTFGVTLLVAGHETTAGQLANFTYLLLGRPDLRRELRSRPELWPAAVEELLRQVPIMSGAGFGRVATEDVELSGVLVRAGEVVLVSDLAANHDPAVYESPERLSFDRPRNPHLSFGHGVHHCLGAQLARMELRVALGALFTRFPGLRLAAGEASIQWRRDSLAHGVATLPVLLSDVDGFEEETA
jgi:cytochrome P450